MTGCGPEQRTYEMEFVELPDEIPARMWPVYVEADHVNGTPVQFYIRDIGTNTLYLCSWGKVQNGRAAGIFSFPYNGVFAARAQFDQDEYIEQLVTASYDSETPLQQEENEKDLILKELKLVSKLNFPITSVHLPDSKPLMSKYIGSLTKPVTKEFGLLKQPELTDISLKVISLFNLCFDMAHKLFEIKSMTVYEDAEDGLTDGWGDIGGSDLVISNVFDRSLNSRVISLSSSNPAASRWTFSYSPADIRWNNDYQFFISWKQKFNSTPSAGQALYIHIDADCALPGGGYLRYFPTDTHDGNRNTYGQWGFGAEAQDYEWHTVWRNLQDDFQWTYDPGPVYLYASNTITSVGWLLNYNTDMAFDDIILYHFLPAWPQTGNHHTIYTNR